MPHLIVIDPHVTLKSPSMRSWVQALPHFRDLFDGIEIWASECDVPEGDGIVWKRVPQRIPTWTFHALDFQMRVARMIAKLPPDKERMVMVTGCLVQKADIRYIHFWNRALLEEVAKRRSTFPFGLRGKVLVYPTTWTERAVTSDPHSTRHWWVVCRSLAERIASEKPPGDFHILPNQYDPARFHSGIRDQWRQWARDTHGIDPAEKILVFASFGHFERKGLLQAMQAMQILRQRGENIRLLVLGGTPKTIAAIKAKCGGDLSAFIFAGLVEDVERHLVAADGLFFPSHFEAFSLAEIEAAALGLRLYLTPHYGTEMILREPENGRFLPWEPEGMADNIARDIHDGTLGKTHSQLGEAINAREYREKIRQLFEIAIATRS